MITYQNKLTISEITALATAREPACLDDNADFRAIIEANRQFFVNQMTSGSTIYGATTGLGSSAKNLLTPEQSRQLQDHLIAYHGCGVGPRLPESVCAATMLLRLNSLVQGRSGVHFALISHLAAMLAKRVIPVIPSRGSVGASGDLTPLSYIAAAMQGKRECYYEGAIVASHTALAAAGITPYEFKEREALAIMNGTSVMTAIASLAWGHCEAIAQRACELTGLLVEMMQARTAPFLPELHHHKPHPGQIEAAARILSLTAHPYHRLSQGAATDKLYNKNAAIQDVYSLRCAPQVIGVLFDSLAWAQNLIEIEANSVNDNPLFFHETEMIVNGGNFFGGHIAIVCDTLKMAVANTVNLLERQMALLMEPRVASFLTENLVLPQPTDMHLNHGFKAMQITMSAITAELVKKALPMCLYSRPTESSNQDVVSMGTTAALELTEILGFAEQAVSIMAMAVCQSFYVLEAQGHALDLNESATTILNDLKRLFAPLATDRPLDLEIEHVRAGLFAGVGTSLWQ